MYTYKYKYVLPLMLNVFHVGYVKDIAYPIYKYPINYPIYHLSYIPIYKRITYTHTR